MRKYSLLLLAAALAWGVLGARPGQAAEDATGPWVIDPVHSSIVWTVGMNSGLGLLYGRFDAFSGTINVDTAEPGNSSVEVTVDAASVNTVNADRDKHLRTPDFFDVDSFAKLSFKSTSVSPVAGAEGEFDITGDLMLHGVTKQVMARAKFLGAGKDPKGVPVAGFTASFSILRSEFGMSYGVPNISDEIGIQLAFSCRQPQPTAPEQ